MQHSHFQELNIAYVFSVCVSLFKYWESPKKIGSKDVWTSNPSFGALCDLVKKKLDLVGFLYVNTQQTAS